MEPKFEDFLVRTSGNATALALLMACFLSLSIILVPTWPVAAAQNVPYNVTVVAHRNLEQGDIGVPIYLDGDYSGFSTPHNFTGLKGIHRLSSVYENENGSYIQGPPVLQANAPTGEFAIIAEDVNWIEIDPPQAPGSTAIVEFNYGSMPFVENFRDTFQPGTLARLGVVVNMDPSQTVNGHINVYNESEVPESDSQFFYSADITIHGVQPAFVQFQIPQGARVGSWVYRVRVNGNNMNFSEDSTFDVASVSAVPVNYPADPQLPYSTFEMDGGQYMLFDNSNSSTVIMFVGGGMIGKIPGPTPINGFSDILGSPSYRLVYDLVKSGFSVVSPNGPWQGLDFPSHLVEYLREEGFNEFYALGHSAGGVVVAWTILNNPGLFKKAVIADAPLTQESTGFYFTDLAVRSEQVKIPQLLVWGRGDSQAAVGDAFAWMDHADPSLAELRIFDYYHDWAGTAAELQVRQHIVNFLKGENKPADLPGGTDAGSSALVSGLQSVVFRGNISGTADVMLLSTALFGSFAYLVFKKRKEK